MESVMQKNRLPTKSPIELKDNSNVWRNFSKNENRTTTEVKECQIGITATQAEPKGTLKNSARCTTKCKTWKRMVNCVYTNIYSEDILALKCSKNAPH